VKPPSFSYAVPESLDEVLVLRKEYGDDAAILAGGQSLVPLMNFRIARPKVLIDIGRVPGLDAITRDDGTLTIGATARQAAVERSPLVAETCPVIVEGMRHVGHVATRARGTFGGSAAHADPVAEIPQLLRALDAQITARGPDGDRVISADDFFVGYFANALADDEVLTDVRIPAMAGARGVFLEVSRRHGDFALVSVAVVARMDGSTVGSARIVMGGVSDVPLRAEDAEASLAGAELDDARAVEAGRLATKDLHPTSDVHASAKYRTRTAGVLVERALKQLTTALPTPT
jgi:aerobic carbon-monoxide dehydrogenase medium subunit